MEVSHHDFPVFSRGVPLSSCPTAPLPPLPPSYVCVSIGLSNAIIVRVITSAKCPSRFYHKIHPLQSTRSARTHAPTLTDPTSAPDSGSVCAVFRADAVRTQLGHEAGAAVVPYREVGSGVAEVRGKTRGRGQASRGHRRPQRCALVSWNRPC